MGQRKEAGPRGERGGSCRGWTTCPRAYRGQGWGKKGAGGSQLACKINTEPDKVNTSLGPSCY